MDIKAAPIAGALISCALLLAAAPAAAQSSRPIFIAPTVGVRDFGSDQDLDSDVSFGLRFGVDATPHLGLLMDWVYTSPSRESTGTPADVTALRGLVRYVILTGSLRPYLLAGVGGVLFDFGDSYDTASIALTLGGGADYRIGSRFSLFAEASVDGYRARTVTYSSTGEEIDPSERETETVLNGTAGIAVEF